MIRGRAWLTEEVKLNKAGTHLLEMEWLYGV